MKEKIVLVIGFSALLLSLFSGLSFSMVVEASFLESIKTVDYENSSTAVGGCISENITWILENSPYIVTDGIIVETDVYLTIEPGVTVRFAENTNLIVDGALIAQGNSTYRIIFTSNKTTPAPGDWGAIKFREMSNDAACVIKWAIIRYAEVGIIAHGSSPKIQNSRIEHNAVFGIYASSLFLYGDGDFGIPLIRNCTISDNGGGKNNPYGGREGGILIDFGSIDIRDSLIENNTGYGIIGVASSGTVVVRSIVRNNTGTGVDGDVTISNSEITGNGQSGIASRSGKVHHCYIFGNTPFDCTNLDIFDMNATHNWWGTTNETLIEEHIYDFYDDYDLGKVLYKPYLMFPDVVPPSVGIPSRIPEGDVQPGQEIKISVNATDTLSNIKNVTLSYDLNNGDVWVNLPMTYNFTTGLYETTIQIQQANTLVKYKIIAYDNAGNHKVEDNSGECYIYTVIPEFPSFLILPLFMIATLLIVIIYRRKYSM